MNESVGESHYIQPQWMTYTDKLEQVPITMLTLSILLFIFFAKTLYAVIFEPVDKKLHVSFEIDSGSKVHGPFSLMLVLLSALSEYEQALTKPQLLILSVLTITERLGNLGLTVMKSNTIGRIGLVCGQIALICLGISNIVVGIYRCFY